MKLTIILTLKGREKFTFRWMRYMNEIHCPYKILLADGGDNLELEAHLQHPDNYPDLDYEYIRYPFDASLDDYLNKFENVISKVKTEYILLADNDDFYLLDRIPELIAFLDDHSDYVAARGQTVYFEVFDSKMPTKAQVQGRRYNAYATYTPPIESDCPITRIKSLCEGMFDNDYYMNWYSITRTSALQKVWKDLMTLRNKEIIILEILSHVLLMNAGKLKVISSPFYLRQSDTSQMGVTLITGNQFLERCISNNAFSAFSIVVERFMGLNNVEDKKDVLKSIAGWLNIFVFNIRRGHQVQIGRRYRFATLIKRVPFFGSLVKYVIRSLRNLVLQTPKTRRLRIKEIEPFIIVRN